MLIVNYRVLNPNTTDPELKKYEREYQDALKALGERFPDGKIQLKRNGYPRISQGHDPNMPITPEVPPPIIIKLTRTDANGVYWGYCKGRAEIQANGLADVPANDNVDVLEGEIMALDLKKNPDYVFYIMTKSGILGTEYSIFDPDGDKRKELLDKNAKLKVQASIRDMADEKLRMMAQAWGIKGAAKKDALLLQEELEIKVFAMEAEKNKDKTNLMLKGINEFLKEMRDDDATRPKAFIKFAADEERLKFDYKNSHYYFDGGDVCFIPLQRQEIKEQALLEYFLNEENKEKWINFLKALVTPEYINALDKYALRWLAAQVDIPLNQKPEELLTALLETFKSK